MKFTAIATTIAVVAGLGLALGACQNRSDEAPDIEEAIPLDEPGDAVTTPLEESPGERAAPTPEPGIDTMESGSNPPGMTEPPEGSKVQPAA